MFSIIDRDGIEENKLERNDWSRSSEDWPPIEIW